MLKIGDKVRVVGRPIPDYLLGLEGEVSGVPDPIHPIYTVFFPDRVITEDVVKGDEDDGYWPMFRHELEVIE